MRTLCPDSSSETDVDFFAKKSINSTDATKSHRKSALSSCLAQVESEPNNPFSQYAKFDGRVSKVAANFPTIGKESIALTMVASK